MDEKLVFTPAPYLVYKPMKSGGGRALKVQLRVEPQWVATEEGGYFEPPKKQGLFLELAPQAGKGEGGFAQFGWKAPELMRCKWGQVDVLKFLTSMREVRELGREVPFAYRGGPDKNAKPFEWASFHKYGDQSTAISYTFEDTRSILRISKSKDHAASIALDLHEELGFQAYVRMALDVYLRAGVR